MWSGWQTFLASSLFFSSISITAAPFSEPEQLIFKYGNSARAMFSACLLFAYIAHFTALLALIRLNNAEKPEWPGAGFG